MKDIEDHIFNKEKRIKKMEKENSVIALNEESESNEEETKLLSDKIAKYKKTLTNWIDELPDDSSLTNNNKEEINDE